MLRDQGADQSKGRGHECEPEMSLLKASEEASVRRTLLPGQVLVPYDHITSIRISFYSLRLAKSDVFTPKLWEYKWIVDEHIRSLTEDSGEFSLNSSLASSLQTSGNNLTLLDRKFQSSSKDSDWDSGFSDG